MELILLLLVISAKKFTQNRLEAVPTYSRDGCQKNRDRLEAVPTYSRDRSVPKESGQAGGTAHILS